MDGKRFDDITRGLAAGPSRRTFLGGLAAAIAGAVGLKARGADAVCSPAGWYCQRNTDCCSGACYASSRNRFYRVCTACVPTTCAALGKTCGEWPNGCGGTLNCGTNCGDCGSCNRETGVCQPTDVVCGPCRTCAFAAGQFNCAIDVGEGCSDGDGCTVNDSCNAQGQCVGTPMVCQQPTNPCQRSVCVVPPTGGPGVCTLQNVPDQPPTACDDLNDCTANDVCIDGLCTGTPDCSVGTDCCVAAVGQICCGGPQCVVEGSLDHCEGCDPCDEDLCCRVPAGGFDCTTRGIAPHCNSCFDCNGDDDDCTATEPFRCCVSKASGDSCSIDFDCCDGFCNFGVCDNCRSSGGICDINGDCCSGVCIDGQCAATCSGIGGPCDPGDNFDCCPNLTCVDFQCMAQ